MTLAFFILSVLSVIGLFVWISYSLDKKAERAAREKYESHVRADSEVTERPHPTTRRSIDPLTGTLNQEDRSDSDYLRQIAEDTRRIKWSVWVLAVFLVVIPFVSQSCNGS